MADLALTLDGSPVVGAEFGPTTVPCPTTQVGEYVVVFADVDYVAADSLTIDVTTGVVDLAGAAGWTLVGTGGANPLVVKAWIGKIVADPGTITVRQDGNTSGLHVHAWPLDPAGGVVAVDGLVTMTDATSPFEHSSISPAGTRSVLFCAHGQVQFTDPHVNTDYGDAPAGMQAAETEVNEFSGMQSCVQVLTAAGPTGVRQQTGVPASGLAGAAGIMFALRSTGTAPAVPMPTPIGVPLTAEATTSPATLTTVPFTPDPGEIIVVKAVAGHSSITVGAPTVAPALALLFANGGRISTTANYTPTRIDTAVVPPGGVGEITISVAFTGSGTVAPTLIVERWQGAQLAGTPATNPDATRRGVTTAAMSSTVTTVGTGSVVTWVAGDWQAVTSTNPPPAYRSGATENYRRRVPQVNVWSAWQPAVTPGVQEIGMTAPTGQKWTMIGVEIQALPAVTGPEPGRMLLAVA